MLAGALDREMFRIAVALPLKFVLGLLESSNSNLITFGHFCIQPVDYGGCKGSFHPNCEDSMDPFIGMC